MLFNIATASLALFTASTTASAVKAHGDESSLLRGPRQLTAPDSRCATDASCYLYNLEKETKIPLGNGVTEYDPSASSIGFSIGCEVPGGKVEYVKYFSSKEEVSTQYFSPERYSEASEQTYWLNGDNSGARVNEVGLLDVCGAKAIDVTFYTWSGGDDFPCFSQNYNIMVKSDGCPPPPKMTSCARSAFKMFYAPDVPIGWQIEGVNPQGESLFLDVQGPSPRPLARFEERWWHKFSEHFLPDWETELRFVNEFGVAGPWHVCKKNSPIGLDIDGSGAVEHITGTFELDITGDGSIETLNEWFAPTEGILVDVSHGIEDGIITGHHLFGDMGGEFSDGFAKLKLFDDDVDGHVSGAELDGFAVWTDSNSNAKLDDGELSTLADHGIVSISTSHVTYVSSATLADGSEMHVEDLWFAR